MQNVSLFRHTDAVSATAEAGEYLNQALTEYRSRPVLLMLSGGSAFNILDFVGKSSLSENLTISVLDERFSQDPEINNFSQLEKTEFFTDALKADCSFFGTLPRNAETPENLSKRWEKNLHSWKNENPKGIIIATLGMGADGHTAGIFPFPKNENTFNQLFENSSWITAYEALGQTKYPRRVTATLEFFKNINLAFALVCGSEKKPKLEELLANNATPAVLPALGWQKIKTVNIFTDITK